MHHPILDVLPSEGSSLPGTRLQFFFSAATKPGAGPSNRRGPASGLSIANQNGCEYACDQDTRELCSNSQ